MECFPKAMPSYNQWQRLGVGQDQDENFTKDFLTTAMSIISKVWKKQSSVVPQEKSQFSISPKKVKQGSNSVLILLTYPLQKDDVVKISVEKNNDILEIEGVKKRNPYTLKISIPDSLTEVSAIVNILVEKNGSFIGSRPLKCESRLRELEQILRTTNNPVEFMCQTLGFSPHDKEQLDNWMHHTFTKNLPPGFSLLGNQPSGLRLEHSCEEYPTLLHFAARFGLEKLTMQLLDCPGGDVACDIRNNGDFIPAEIAENCGHLEIAHILRGYMKMNEFTTMYAKLKEMSTRMDQPDAKIPDRKAEDGGTKQNAEAEDAEHYLIPRNANDLYKICPPPRPVNPVVPLQGDDLLGYMAMNSRLKDGNSDSSCAGLNFSQANPFSSSLSTFSAVSAPLPAAPPSSLSFSTAPSTLNLSPMPSTPFSLSPTSALPSPDLGSSTSSLAPSSLASSSVKSCKSEKKPKGKDKPITPIPEDKVQTELLEIINDFKNNVHSITQAEKLVAEWKNRNDVQKSFKEKQEQLNEMRLKYDRIQQEMKCGSKKTNPFERVKKLFSWGSKGKEEEKRMVSSNNVTIVPSQRPISSLSLQSTSSK